MKVDLEGQEESKEAEQYFSKRNSYVQSHEGQTELVHVFTDSTCGPLEREISQDLALYKIRFRSASKWCKSMSVREGLDFRLNKSQIE